VSVSFERSPRGCKRQRVGCISNFEAETGGAESALLSGGSCAAKETGYSQADSQQHASRWLWRSQTLNRGVERKRESGVVRIISVDSNAVIAGCQIGDCDRTCITVAAVQRFGPTAAAATRYTFRK
jgi:hypothetical protein